MDQFVENRQGGEGSEIPVNIQEMMVLIQRVLTSIIESADAPAREKTDIQKLRQMNEMLRKCLLELDKMMETEKTEYNHDESLCSK